MLSRYYDSMLKDVAFEAFDPIRIFDNIYSIPLTHKNDIAKSSSRVETNGDSMTLSLDIPGVKSKDLSVQVIGRDVKVSGKLRDAEFKQTYRISREYDLETIAAELEDGVLTLKFSKAPEIKSKMIDVKVK